MIPEQYWLDVGIFLKLVGVGLVFYFLGHFIRMISGADKNEEKQK